MKAPGGRSAWLRVSWRHPRANSRKPPNTKYPLSAGESLVPTVQSSLALGNRYSTHAPWQRRG